VLDRVSLPATPSRPPAALVVNRASDPPTSPSAFTSFVDALTEPGAASRDSAPAAGGCYAPPQGPDEDEDTPDGSVDGVPVVPSGKPQDPVASAPGAPIASGATPAVDTAALAIEQALARLRAMVPIASTGCEAQPDTPAQSPEGGDSANVSSTAAALADLLDGAGEQDANDGNDANGDAASADSQSTDSNGSHPRAAATGAAATTSATGTAANAMQAALARFGAEGEPAAKKALEATFAAALGNTVHTEAAALKTMAVGGPWATVVAATGSSIHSVLAASPALASAAAEVPTTDTGMQIVQSMRLQWANGVGEARIALEPNHFGEVSVSLRVEQGQVFARVQAELPAVREWLQTNLGWLRQSLTDQGLTLGRIEVTEPAAESNHDDRRQQPREGKEQPPSRKARQLLPGETFEVVA
jgi:hypothetical protein